MSSIEHNIVKKLIPNTGNQTWHLSCFLMNIRCLVKALHKIHCQKFPFLDRYHSQYRYVILLILAFLVLLKCHKSQHVSLHHNFMLNLSTGLYGSRILSSIYIYYELLLLVLYTSMLEQLFIIKSSIRMTYSHIATNPTFLNVNNRLCQMVY